MDNNFIKIDDLVRQHLEGAEENERAGAWLRMRDLLDEEMPRKKRVGIIYWKRIFGLVAAASLIGTMAVGSYELSSVYRRSASNDPMSVSSGKDFSREAGTNTLDVQPTWMGDEPATSGKINIRRAAHNPIANEATNTTTATEKPYNGGDNSNYMAAIASAANTNKNKSGEAATRNVDNVVANNTTTTATASNAGSNSNSASTSRLATTSAHQLPGHNTGMEMAVTHPVPSTVTGSNSTVYNNTQEQGSIHAKRNHKYSSNNNSNNSSNNNTQATVANDYNHNSNNSETATNSGSRQAITANNNTGNNNNNRLATATNSSNSNNNNSNNNNSSNNSSQWQGTAANSNSDSRIVPNNPVNDDANRNKSGKNYKNSKNQNVTPKSIACSPVNNNNNKGINRRKATADNGNYSTNTASNSTNNNDGLSGSISARRNRRNGNAIPRIATTAGSPMPTTDARIADAGTHTLPVGTNSSNPATGNATTQKIGALNAAPSTGMHTGNTGHKPATTHTVPGTASSAPTTSSTNGKSGHTGNYIAGSTTANNNNIAGNNATTSRTTSTGTGESGSIKGHRNAKTTTTSGSTTATGHGVAKTTGSGSKPTNPATSVLASSAKVDKHTVTGKTPDANNDDVTDDQDTDETAQKLEGDKKVITKIVLRQREVKNGNETHTQVDTVSMEKFSKQSEVPAEGNDPLSGNVTAKRGTNTPPPAAAAEPDNDTKLATAEKATGSKKHRKRHNSGEELAAAPAATTDAEDAPRTALADAPAENAAAATATPSEVTTKKKSSERKSGASLLQKLSSAFNDVKQNATGAKFTPGITAGINSNFFGPSKMMGFQFGATGSFDFNETWSLMAELKYFNRINNNNIEDNYYSYTDMGNGQYRRELIRNTYDFAAMHTVELPLIIRYAKGNFNFYAGGNLQYAFSINTAPASTPDPTAQATFVSAPGTDNKPTYTEADFRSRFALGYIFGFSYQIAPNTSLDIRNVQSVWDNAATTGARSISNMLYRTPSVQLSVMYRLGGNKNKE